LKALGIIFLVVLVVAVIVASQALFTVDQTQFGVVTRFGQIQRIIEEPGLKVKTPFIEQVTHFDNRLLRIDVRIESMPDREQQFLEIDAYVRYRITDPRKFLERLRDEFTAGGRIGNIVISEIRRVVAASDRTEIIGGVTRKEADGTVVVDANKTEDGVDSREALTRLVLLGANAAVKSPENDFGVDIIDVRIKAADFPGTVEQTVFNRMRTERDVQAQRLRAEGAEQNLTITADVDREVTIIRAEADRTANALRGEGEAEAIRILADALGQDEEFFAFRRSLEAYTKFLTQNSTLVLSSENDLFAYLESPLIPTPEPGK
jgi:membrane protease subunit HflC